MSSSGTAQQQPRATLHWTLQFDTQQIAWLTLDKSGASANSLSREVMTELDARLREVVAGGARGLAICSGKTGFIAGADVAEFAEVRTPEEALPFIHEAHAILARLEGLPCPSVAVINGYCLGGGLELALACRYRVCVDEAKVTLGLPEVMLGIHPGFGGTVRAVRQVGVSAAMDMMLSGRNLRPDRALAIGLVDRVVPRHALHDAARQLILNSPAPRRPPLIQRVLGWPVVRPIVARRMYQQVAKRARRDHYPAPYAIVDLWQQHGANERTGFRAEAASVAQLVCSPTSRNLVRVFFLQERLKRLGEGNVKDADQTKAHVHVVGAGVMGGDIAAWCAVRNCSVTLQDKTPDLVQAALIRAESFFAKRSRIAGQAEQYRARLQMDVPGDGVDNADVIIEAIVENIEAKRALFGTIEPRLKPGAVLATNTSSIMLETLSQGLADPARLVGLHFFNPVTQMPLVEVISCTQTSAATLTAALTFTRTIDKLPLPCKSAPGFLVNRVLMPYLTEAMYLAREGLPLAEIDRVAERFGMPIGPIELADTVGLDVCLHVGRILAAAYGRAAPDELAALVEAGKLGRKSGRGLYEWQDGKPRKTLQDAVTAGPPVPEDAEDRLILPMLNEAVTILREGVVAEEDLIDVGVIFGTGFPPFRGGPLRHARERGIANVVATLRRLEQLHGARFSPDPGWQALDPAGL